MIIKKDHISIASGITHKYTLIVEFIEKDKNQNYNQGKIFSGKINISGTTPKPVNNCTFNGELVQGVEYVNGQYTYRYMQEYDYGDWKNIDDTGWGVILTDKTSTDPVTTKLCTNINNKPIVSMAQMFAVSQVPSVDFSSFDTSNVTDMYYMFFGSGVNTIYVSDNWDVSNVKISSSMFGLCGGLVGESGTSYAESDIDEILYARIDKLTEFQGYFTLKTN